MTFAATAHGYGVDPVDLVGVYRRRREAVGCDLGPGADHEQDHRGPADRPSHQSTDGRVPRHGSAECLQSPAVARRGQHAGSHRLANDDREHAGHDRQRGRQPVRRARRLGARVHVAARRQHRANPVHPSYRDGRAAVRVLHPRWWHGDPLGVRRDVPVMGSDPRPPGCGRRDGRFPQLCRGFVGAGGRAVPRRSQRLRFRPQARARQRGHLWDRSCPRHRQRRERRRQPHLGDRTEAVAGRRDRADPRPVCVVSLHRRRVAAGSVPLVDREQWHPPRSAQQLRGDGLRHRGVRGTQSAGMAVICDRGRCPRVATDRDPRQRVRPVARRRHRVLSPAAARRCRGALPSGDGNHARHRDLLDRLPGYQL